MKYVVSWETKPNSTEETNARSLQVFSKWSPPEGANFREFLARLDNSGGYAVIEADDPALIAQATAPFAAWLDFSVHPVIEITDSAQIQGDAVAFLNSIS